MERHTPPASVQLSVLILAGGQSSRMGEDKALIAVAGTPMICRVRDAVRPFLPPNAGLYGITPWPERYVELLPDCQWLPERYTDGPLAAFLQALPHLPGEWVLLLACDLPLLSSTRLGQWLKLLPQVSDRQLAALPRSSTHGWQPLCGFWRRRVFNVAIDYLAEGGRSFQGLIERLPIYELPGGDDPSLRNCNSPQDLPSAATFGDQGRRP